MRKRFLLSKALSVEYYRESLAHLKNNRESRLIVESTIWQVLEKGFRLSSALVWGVLLARYLQPQQYGVYNYALAFTSFFVVVSSLGTNKIFTRDIIENREQSQEIVSTAVILRITSGVLCSALAILAARVFVEDSTSQLLIAIFSMQMVFRASEAVECFFHSRTEHRQVACAKSLASGISTLLVIAAISSRQSIFILATISVLEVVVSLALLISAYIRENQSLRPYLVDFYRLRRTLADSWPLILSGIAITIYMRVDQLMLNSMSGTAELGLYSAVVQITEAFYLLPIAFVHSTFPKIIRLKNDNEKEFYTSLQRIYNKVSLISYSSIFIVSIFSKDILSILYGESYLKASPILCLLIWSVIFVTLGVARSSFMIAMNWTRIHLVTVVAASIINVSLNYALIPSLGGLGAAVATVISYWFAVHGACLVFPPLWKTGKMITKSLIFVS